MGNRRSNMDNGLARYLQDIEMGNQEMLAQAIGGIGPDYDYSKMGNRDNRGHGTDAGKLPWHPTFSNQSYYSSLANPGGQWKEGYNSKGMKTQSYTPSVQSVRNGNTQGLERYMKEVEPSVILRYPEKTR